MSAQSFAAPLLGAAVRGLGDAQDLSPSTQTPCDALIDSLDALDPARRFLLAAGAASIAQRAAGRPLRSVERAAPAPRETRAVCRPEAAQVFDRIAVGPFRDLLEELGERLDRSFRRLPAEILPRILDLTEERTRSALRGALGERGPWLAQQPAAPESWRWATMSDIDVASKESDLEARLDGPDLHARIAAADELAERPDSGLVARLSERASQMLLFSPLEISLPEALDPAWKRDLAQTRAPAWSPLRKEAFWFVRTLARVPPRHWIRRFEAEPRELLDAARRHPRGRLALDGWTRAAARFGDALWAEPLFDFWLADDDPAAPSKLRLLLPAITSSFRDERLIPVLRESPRPDLRRLDLLAAVPRPWSIETAKVFLEVARREAREIRSANLSSASAEDPLWIALPAHARDLPEEILPVAGDGWPELDPDDWRQIQCKQKIEAFRDRVEIRTILIRAIP